MIRYTDQPNHRLRAHVVPPPKVIDREPNDGLLLGKSPAESRSEREGQTKEQKNSTTSEAPKIEPLRCVLPQALVDGQSKA